MATILVCDDEPDILQLVSGRLRRAGHEVLLASSGQECLELAIARQPDIAIIDWMLPDITGLDVCSELRGRADTGTMKVIVLTARAQATDLEAAFAAGADDYLIKPFRPEALQEGVNALLHRR